MATPVVTVHLDSDPFAKEPANASEFYLAVGRYLAVWGNLESHFNSALLILINAPGAKALITHPRQSAPVSFTDKSRAWRRVVSHLPTAAPFKAAALNFVTDFMAATRDRSTLIHSGWEKFVPGEVPTMKLSSLRWNNGVTQLYTATVSVENLKTMLDTASRLNKQLAQITLRFDALTPPHKPSS